MQAHNHESTTFAFVATSAMIAGFRPLPAFVLGCLGAVSADWCDIDSEKSRVVSMCWWIPVFPWVMRNISALVFDLCATDADRARHTAWGSTAFRVHRGFWHSVWGALATGVVWWALLSWSASFWPVQARAIGTWFGTSSITVLIAGVLSWGMLGHILGDGCTNFAVAPLAPVWKWKGHRYVRMGLWAPLRFKVGGGARKDPKTGKVRKGMDVEKVWITPICVGIVCWSLLTFGFGLWSLVPLWGLPLGFVWAVLPVRWAKKMLKPFLDLVPKDLRRSVRKLLVVK